MRQEAEGEGSARGGFPLFRGPRGRRLRRYAPVVLWVGVIFLGSTSNLSATNTSRIIRPLLLWLFPDITEPELASAHFFVRKAAHFVEYAVLALLAARAFISSERPALRRHWPGAAFALVVACALLDEYHQSFLSARAGTVYDSLLDMSGGACALAALGLLRRFFREKSPATEEKGRRPRGAL